MIFHPFSSHRSLLAFFPFYFEFYLFIMHFLYVAYHLTSLVMTFFCAYSSALSTHCL